MFRAIFLIIMALLPVCYQVFFKEIFSFIMFGLAIMGVLILYLLISWVTSQKATSYSSVKLALRDGMFDIFAIILSTILCCIWWYSSTSYFRLTEIEFFVTQGYYVLILIITVIEAYMTLNNSLMAMRKLVVND